MLVQKNSMRVLITGSRGFVGKNLVVRLSELPGYEVVRYDHEDLLSTLDERVQRADAIVHLAGVNRPSHVAEFAEGNADLTARLCSAVKASGRRIPLVLASSIQAELDNPYGQSKRAAEQVVEQLAAQISNSAVIYRLPNLFGKWCKPNYNSVVATFCHNVANDLPIKINDPSAQLRLAYVDDVVSAFLDVLSDARAGVHRGEVSPIYGTTLGELGAQVMAFKNCRSTLVSERVGVGFARALYATYVSYLPLAKFSYEVPSYGDHRGVFVEMLKTRDSGQFSFFTAHPGITRGGHYHHSKTEKFLVIKGTARFRFRHIITNACHELVTLGDEPRVVETVPGWTHDITNIGEQEMVVMLWANEIFDRERPDTYASPL
jgi:UDP-2-acetamido-2,6-beta-L-arabino-hexul-4-ose reductase